MKTKQTMRNPLTEHWLCLPRLSIKLTVIATPEAIFFENQSIDTKSQRRRKPRGSPEKEQSFLWYLKFFEKYEDDPRIIYSRNEDTQELVEIFLPAAAPTTQQTT